MFVVEVHMNLVHSLANLIRLFVTFEDSAVCLLCVYGVVCRQLDVHVVACTVIFEFFRTGTFRTKTFMSERHKLVYHQDTDDMQTIKVIYYVHVSL